MTAFEKLQVELQTAPRRWLITGVAGFIGSHLLERLLALGQFVVGIDNFVTGRRENLEAVRQIVGEASWARFRFHGGDINCAGTCQTVCEGIELVLHQAALGSVPRSIADPIRSFENNVMGLIKLLAAARDQRVKRLVFASSSAVYGSHPDLPKREDNIGQPLSPYAATKFMNEVTAGVFARCYDCETVGLRYFNVFGPRQDPNGPYAAVIPKWIAAILAGEPIVVNGDGETSRDFCFVENVVQANLLAALSPNPDAVNTVYNVARSDRVTLNELFFAIRRNVARRLPSVANVQPVYQAFRPGDVRHSQASIDRARDRLGYQPTHTFEQGLTITTDWHLGRAVKHPATLGL